MSTHEYLIICEFIKVRGRGKVCENGGKDFFKYLEKEGWILKFLGEKQSLGNND